jgi:hypothetical protein
MHELRAMNSLEETTNYNTIAVITLFDLDISGFFGSPNLASELSRAPPQFHPIILKSTSPFTVLILTICDLENTQLKVASTKRHTRSTNNLSSNYRLHQDEIFKPLATLRIDQRLPREIHQPAPWSAVSLGFPQSQKTFTIDP